MAAIVLVALLYFFGNTTPPKQPMANKSMGSDTIHGHAHAFNWDSTYQNAYKALPEHGRGTIDNLNKQVAAASDSVAMIPYFNQLSDAWLAHKEPIPAGYYKYLAAKLENSENNLTFAAQFLLDIVGLENISDEERHWAADMAIASTKQALNINPENDTAQMVMAVALIEGEGETMQGVQQLLAITRKNPNHIPANLMLGKMSIQSGQWDKAVARLENVLQQEPKNREAMFFLAEAYKGQGKKQEGIQQLEKLKSMVNDSAFSADIDQYIKTF